MTSCGHSVLAQSVSNGGNLNLSPGSTLNFNLYPLRTPNSDQLHLSGELSYSNPGTFNFSFTDAGGGAKAGDTYTLITFNATNFADVSSFKAQMNGDLAGFTGKFILTQPGLGGNAPGMLQLQLTSGSSGDKTPPDTRILSGPTGGAVVGAGGVIFTYTGTDDTTPTASLQYQYRIDKGAWQGPGSRTSATLTGLSNGMHTFQVAAIDQAGNIDPTPASATFVVDSGLLLPDLTVTQFKTPTSARQDDTITVSWTVQNIGQGNAVHPWTDTVYLSTSATFDPSTAINVGSIAQTVDLAVGTSYSEALTLTMPQNLPGAYYLMVVTDSGNQVTEADETNNVGVAGFQLLKVQHLVISPSPLNVTVTAGGTQAVPISLSNLGSVALTSIQATASAQDGGIQVAATSLPASLPAMPSDGSPVMPVTAAVTVTASAAAAHTSTATLIFTTAENEQTEVDLNITVVPLAPMLTLSPSVFSGGMVQGKQTLLEVAVTNNGNAAATNLTVTIPQLPWMGLTTPAQIASLAPGATAKVVLSLMPATTLPIGIYKGQVAINGDNASIAIPYSLNCISVTSGNVMFVSQDELTFFADSKPLVTGASVTVSDAGTGTVFAQGQTDSTGSYVTGSLPAGSYNVTMTASGHDATTQPVTVIAGQTTESDVFIHRDFVTYQWTVLPIEIEDTYAVSLTAVFDTNVPAPVITVEPKRLALSDITFDDSGKAIVYYTVTNHGLIAVDEGAFAVPATTSGYTATPAITNIGKIEALTTLIIPVTIEKTGAIVGSVAFAPVPISGGQASIMFSGLNATAQKAQLNSNISTAACVIGVVLTYHYLCGGDRNEQANAEIELACAPIAGMPGGYLPSNVIGFGADPGGIYTVPPFWCNPCIQSILGSIQSCYEDFQPTECTNWPILKTDYDCLKDVFKAATGSTEPLESVESCVKSAAALLICLAKVSGEVVEPWIPVALGLAECAYDIIKTANTCNEAAGNSLASQSLLRAASKLSGSGGGSGSGGDPALAPYLAALQTAADDIVAETMPVRTLLGNDKWVQPLSPNDAPNEVAILTAFVAAIDSGSDGGMQITDAESNAISSLPLPSTLTAADVTQLIARWNRSLTYFAEGIFTAGNVPAGQSTDFIDLQTMQTTGLAAQAAANTELAEGSLGLLDSITAAKNNLQQYLLSPQQAGTCAQVTIQLNQEVAITRTAFQATLQINASAQATTPLTNVHVTLSVLDATLQTSQTSQFVISDPTVTGFASGGNGNGTIAIGSNGTLQWTILPTRDAAPSSPTTYYVSGTISYDQDGSTVNLPLFPAGILVYPDPYLDLKYFWSRDVYGDDPFTSIVEPAEPFALGVLVTNQGGGTARNMSITSAQPQIVDNQKGLLVNFNIIGSAVNTQAVSPSLKAILGDIPGFDPTIGTVTSANTATATYLMTSSIEGQFVAYDAAFQNTNALGTTKTSLIDSVSIHELEHVVRVDYPNDDNKPDFLAVDTANPDHIPDTLYNSDGSISKVTAITTATVDAPISSIHLAATLILPQTPTGYTYVRLPDPSSGKFRLTGVMRADGRVIRVGANTNGDSTMGNNAWTTARTIDLTGQTPYVQYRLYLFDINPTSTYTLIYGYPPPTLATVGVLKTLPDGSKVEFGGSGGDGSGAGGPDSGGGVGTGTGSGGDGTVAADLTNTPLVVTGVFSDSIYAEVQDRSAGIKIINAPSSLQENDLILGAGTILTGSNGERYINATSVTRTGSLSPALAPLGIPTKPLWCGDFFYSSADGSGQRGMTGGNGLSNIGLLIRTLGRVQSVNNNSVMPTFTMDDGYGNPLTVAAFSSGSLPATGDFVDVTGDESMMESIINNVAVYSPLLRVRHVKDQTVLSGASLRSYTIPQGLLTANGDNLFALPAVPADAIPYHVLSVFDPQGNGSGLQGRFTRYDAPTQSEVYYEPNDPGAFGGLLLGEGYRLHINSGEPITFTYSGYPYDFADSWIGMPKLGATRIGDPFVFGVDWQTVSVSNGIQVISLQQASQVQVPGWLSSIAQYFDSATQSDLFLGLPSDNKDSTTLQPWTGYYVTGMQDNLALIVPTSQTSPIVVQTPVLLSLSPNTVAPGGGDFTLTVTGQNFQSNSQVLWNGSPRSTTFVSGTSLSATITAADIESASTNFITVVTPSSSGNLTSNALVFVVGVSRIALTSISSIVRNSDNSLTVVAVLTNTGSAPAVNVTLTGSTLTAGGAGAPTTSVPLPSAGDIAAGTSVSLTLTFPPSAAASGSSGFVAVAGQWANGTFSGSRKVIIP